MSVPGTDAESPECLANISAAGVSPDPFDGSDIIPFHDSEYEEIGENDLMFTYGVDSDGDENSCKSTVEKNPEVLSSESMEAGLDSALGRSVSNPSLHIDSRCSVPAVLVNDTELNTLLSHTGGALDFGYSSEGHSNEEPENVIARKQGRGNVTAGGKAVDNRLDEVSVWNAAGLDSAGTSGVGTNTVQRRGFYHMTDASINESAANSPAESHLHSSLHREPLGEETDDDFTGLNELPLDDAPSASELDLLAKLATLSDNNRTRLMRVHGRSLDSLAPLGSDKLFSAEKRISSVEIIVDSVGSSSRPSLSSQVSRDSAADDVMPGDIMMNNRFHLQAPDDSPKFLAPSSCDASSEGTLSDSEFSDLGNSDGTGSPSKSRSLVKRVRRPVRGGPSKSCKNTLIRSPTKRRMEYLLENPTAASDMTRSTSHDDIDPNHPQNCSGLKRSKICRSMSDLPDAQSPKKGNVGRRCKSNLVLPRKFTLRRSPHKLNFVHDVSDYEAPHLAAVANKDQYISQHSTGVCIFIIHGDDAVKTHHSWSNLDNLGLIATETCECS